VFSWLKGWIRDIEKTRHYTRLLRARLVKSITHKFEVRYYNEMQAMQDQNDFIKRQALDKLRLRLNGKIDNLYAENSELSNENLELRRRLKKHRQNMIANEKLSFEIEYKGKILDDNLARQLQQTHISGNEITDMMVKDAEIQKKEGG